MLLYGAFDYIAPPSLPSYISLRNTFKGAIIFTELRGITQQVSLSFEGCPICHAKPYIRERTLEVVGGEEVKYNCIQTIKIDYSVGLTA